MVDDKNTAVFTTSNYKQWRKQQTNIVLSREILKFYKSI